MDATDFAASPSGVHRDPKWPPDVYENYEAFYERCLLIAKDRINTYNIMLKRFGDNKSSIEIGKLAAVIYKIFGAGLTVWLTVSFLLSGGIFAFFIGIGALIATNPVIAAAVALLGGGAVKILWRKRDVVKAVEKIRKRYEPLFEACKSVDPNTAGAQSMKVIRIERLMTKCVEDICIEAYHINLQDMLEMEMISAENKDS